MFRPEESADDDSLSFEPPTEAPPDENPLSPPPYQSSEVPPAADEPVRYSLFELLVLMTLAAVMLASLRFVGVAAFASIAGVLGFFMLVFISIFKPNRGIVHVAWWVLMAIYLTASVAAILNKDM